MNPLMPIGVLLLVTCIQITAGVETESCPASTVEVKELAPAGGLFGVRPQIVLFGDSITQQVPRVLPHGPRFRRSARTLILETMPAGTSCPNTWLLFQLLSQRMAPVLAGENRGGERESEKEETYRL